MFRVARSWTKGRSELIITAIGPKRASTLTFPLDKTPVLAVATFVSKPCLPRCRPMATRSVLLSLCVLTVLTAGESFAQVAPTVPATPAAAVPAVSAQPVGFWGGLGAMHKSHKEKFSNSPLCKLLKNAMKPLSALTGGLIPPPQDHGPGAAAGGGDGPPPPAVGAAAKIKQEAAQAEARRAAVEFLGTVDCHWYPEAEKGLIAALRGDRSECVRLEAALALGKGCCCTKKTIEALRIAAEGSQEDGNPGERCMRVRVAAYEALQNCLLNCTEALLETGTQPATSRPETPEAPLDPANQAPSLGQSGLLGFSAYYEQLAARPVEPLLSRAKLTVARLAPREQAVPPTTSNRSLFGIWASAAEPLPAGVPEIPNENLSRPGATERYLASSPPASPVANHLGVNAAIYQQVRRLPAVTEPKNETIFLSRQRTPNQLHTR